MDGVLRGMPAKDRSYLAYEILLRCSYRDETAEISDRSKGKHLGIDRLLSKKAFLTVYPMHDVRTLAFLQSIIIALGSSPLPLAFQKLDTSVKIGEIDIKELNDRQILWHYWAKFRRFGKLQPLHVISRYLGEKLAFYFAFVGFYTSSLLVPSLLGLLALVYGIATFSSDIPTYKRKQVLAAIYNQIKPFKIFQK